MATPNDNPTFIVDDSDTDRIAYNDGHWQAAGVQGEFNKTTHGAYDVGAFCTFVFKGTSVSVFGTVISTIESLGTVTSTYVLDDDPVQTFSSPLTLSRIMQVLFYQSATLADTKHTLVITGASSFWLDYILYTTEAPPSAMPLVSSASAIATSTSNSASTSNATSLSLSTATPTKSSSLPTTVSRPPKPIEAIVGGILGGAVFLVVAVLLFMGVQRYKHTTTAEHNGNWFRQELRHGQVIPFPISLQSTPPIRKTNLEKQTRARVATVVQLHSQSWMDRRPSLGSTIGHHDVTLHDNEGIRLFGGGSHSWDGRHHSFQTGQSVTL